MSAALIGLGSNVGDRAGALDRALRLLDRHRQVAVVSTSARHVTPAIGGPGGQADYLNAAARLETSLAPRGLLAELLRIERLLGRRPGPRWAARVIDLDLLLYDDLIVDSPSLRLPHPRMAHRRFVLAPAAEAAPDMVHPVTGWTVRRLWEHLDRAADYVAIAGPPGAGKSALAGGAAVRTRAVLLTDPCAPARRPPPRDNSTGQAWAAEVEFLDRRLQLLSGFEAGEDGGRTVYVSDFWLDQTLAYAQQSLAGDQLEQFEERWRRARRSVLRPKLLVLLLAPTAMLAKIAAARTSSGGGRAAVEPLRQIQAALRRLAMEKDQGPVLPLDAAAHDLALEEVAAAIQAMR